MDPQEHPLDPNDPMTLREQQLRTVACRLFCAGISTSELHRWESLASLISAYHNKVSELKVLRRQSEDARAELAQKMIDPMQTPIVYAFASRAVAFCAGIPKEQLAELVSLQHVLDVLNKTQAQLAQALEELSKTKADLAQARIGLAKFQASEEQAKLNTLSHGANTWHCHKHSYAGTNPCPSCEMERAALRPEPVGRVCTTHHRPIPCPQCEQLKPADAPPKPVLPPKLLTALRHYVQAHTNPESELSRQTAWERVLEVNQEGVTL